MITQSRAYQLSAMPNEYNLVDRQNYSRYYPRRLQAEVLLDAIDHLAGTQTDFANLPPGRERWRLPDNSYNRSSPVPAGVFGRPEAASVCECERVQSSSLAQSLHLMNSPEMKAKLANSSGRAERLAKEDKPARSENPRALSGRVFARAASRRIADGSRLPQRINRRGRWQTGRCDQGQPREVSGPPLGPDQFQGILV